MGLVINNMKRTFLFWSLLVWIGGCEAIAAELATPLLLEKKIPLPDVAGRIDHLTFDSGHNRLFVAALGNNSVEVVDLSAGKVIKSLRHFSEPQGVLYLADNHRLYVANGGDGTLRVIDTESFTELKSLTVGDDADNLRYDSSTKQVYVGYGRGAIGVVDTQDDSLLCSIPLSGHPESFQLEKDGARIFVNVPGAHEVSVLDRSTRKQVDGFKLGFAAANFPMALDSSNHRLFVACRMPARMLVFDTLSGKEISKVGIHRDCDDLYYDAARKLLYASCGEGFIDVIEQEAPDKYTVLANISTEPKARTCLWQADTLFLAVPAQRAKEAHLLVYRIAAGETFRRAPQPP